MLHFYPSKQSYNNYSRKDDNIFFNEQYTRILESSSVKTVHSLSIYHLTVEDIHLGKTKVKRYKFDDKGKPVAAFTVFDWWDGKNIENLRVYSKYKGLGLSYLLLDYATKKLGVKNLAVRKNNKIAKHVYDKYGFVVKDESDDLYYMSLKR